MLYQPAGCHNDMGYLVPCAQGQNVFTPFALTPAAVQAVPQQVAVEQKAEAAPAADSGVISVKKRASEAVSDPLYYADTIGRYPGVINAAWQVGAPVAVPTSYTVSEPVVKSVVATAPVAKSVVPATYVATAPIVSTTYVANGPISTPYIATAPVAAAPVSGCMNGQGSYVPCAN